MVGHESGMMAPAIAGGRPCVRELIPVPDPWQAFQAVSQRAHCAFLDSAMRHPSLGRYSYLAVDPVSFHRFETPTPQVFHHLRKALASFESPTCPELPPFQGGWIVLLGYDLHRALERIAAPRWTDLAPPAAALGAYDAVVSWDHQAGRAWVVSTGFPLTDPGARTQRAEARAAWLQHALQRSPPATPRGRNRRSESTPRLAPSYEVESAERRGLESLISSHTREAYLEQVARAIEYIRAGDVFQVNLSQRLLHPAIDDPVALYGRLRARNPATFAAYLDLGEYQILSASPERLLSLQQGEVETRPIKGTCPTTRSPEGDYYAGRFLQRSAKDRAENIMIVDLMRNDLSRVCQPDSVEVTQLCRLETYQFVQHLVSAVRGRLRPDADRVELIESVFPGGSITGAPKVRAMEIIRELEPVARGAYCGSIGFLGFDGSLDLNILIRTITAGCGWWQLPVGGGIVADSVPHREYEETWQKARGLIEALLP